MKINTRKTLGNAHVIVEIEDGNTSIDLGLMNRDEAEDLVATLQETIDYLNEFINN